VKDEDGYMGGTAFERNDRANPVKKGTRCYTIGNSAEGPTRIMAPNKNAKAIGKDDDRSLEMRKSLELVRFSDRGISKRLTNRIQSTTALAALAMEQGPAEALQNIRDNASLVNAPTLGHHENYAQTATQVNFAPAQRIGSST